MKGKPSDHPRIDRIWDCVGDKLSPKEEKALGDHLARCERCREIASWARGTRQVLRDGLLVSPPGWLLAEAQSMLPDRAEGRRREFVPFVVSKLVFDSFRQPMPVGVREWEGSGRQLLYETEDFDIDLNISCQGECWSMVGQVLPKNGRDRGNPRVTVQIFFPRGEALSCEADSYGEFAVMRMTGEPSYLKVQLESGQQAIIIPIPSEPQEVARF